MALDPKEIYDIANEHNIKSNTAFRKRYDTFGTMSMYCFLLTLLSIVIVVYTALSEPNRLTIGVFLVLALIFSILSSNTSGVQSKATKTMELLKDHMVGNSKYDYATMNFNEYSGVLMRDLKSRLAFLNRCYGSRKVDITLLAELEEITIKSISKLADVSTGNIDIISHSE